MKIEATVQEFVYQEQGSGKTTFSRCRVTRETERIAVAMFGGLAEAATTASFSPDWTLRHWKMEGEGYTPRHLEQKNGAIYANDQELFSPTVPWIQDGTFALQPFIASPKQELTFHTIDPRDLSRIEVVAKKEGLEEISLKGEKREGLRIRLQLTGWKSWLWSGVCHFDPKEGYLLRMQGKSIVPSFNFTRELFQRSSHSATDVLPSAR